MTRSVEIQNLIKICGCGSRVHAVVVSRQTGVGIGRWIISVPGAGGEPIADIGLGSSGNVYAIDVDGDNTALNWNVPNPNFSARFPEKQVHGYGWALGSSVTVSIDDPDYGTNVDYSATLPVIVAPWDATQTFVQFTLDDQPGFELQPGQIVTMSGIVEGMAITKVHTVSVLAITGVDVDYRHHHGYR